MEVKILNTTIGAIEYSVYGKGEPILFIHGGHSNANDTLTHKHIDPNKFTLITPTRAGYGNTPISANKTPIDAAKQIIELMDNLNFSRFNVIGISAGGLTAIALASQYPERVKKLVLASAVTKRWLHPDDELYKKGKRLFNPKIEKYTWALMKFFLSLFPKLIIKKMASELTTQDIEPIRKEDIKDMKSMLLISRSGNGFVTDLKHDLEEKIIESIKVPTLIIHSKNDKAVSEEHPHYAKEKIEGAKLIWIDNDWGHMIWLGKESEKTIQHISIFLLGETEEVVTRNNYHESI